MGMVVPVYYTAEMVRSLPNDGKRYEVVHGELFVTPAPRAVHQLIVRRLTVALDVYLARHRVGAVFSSPADISWSEDTLVQPDVFVAVLEEARTLDWRRMQHLLLAIEVLSPTTARADRFAKRRLYQEIGVPVYWAVDPDTRVVEVWEPPNTAPAVERERLAWRPEKDDPLFTLDLQELFGSI